MKEIFRKPIFVFFLLVFCIGLPLCIFPINLFDGEYIVSNGIVEVVEKGPGSLSYLFSLENQDKNEMPIIEDFYLQPTGYLLAFIFIFGIPALIAYRVYLKNDKHSQSQK